MHKYDSIVVKIEYRSFSKNDGTLDPVRMERMAMILSNLHNSGKHLLLVTSGAIALGTSRLKMKEPPGSLIHQQATAAVGQAELINIYQNFFEIFNQRIAQVLLTNDVIDHNERKQNALNTFNTLFEMDIIPVINTNDTVSTEDIEFNDNYPLALNVAKISGSNMIIFRGEEEGSYYILMSGENKAEKVTCEDKLIREVEKKLQNYTLTKETGPDFPASMNNIIFN